jgi:phosphoglycerate dehydrogenase-like enzyme
LVTSFDYNRATLAADASGDLAAHYAEAVVSARPQVVVLDPIRSIEWSYEVERGLLADRDVDLIVPTDGDAPAGLLAACDVIVSSGRIPIDAEFISRLPSGTAILCYSAGRDAVDERAAAAAGIRVSSVHPASDDVADHALALLLAAVRLIAPLSVAAEAGDWSYTNHPEIYDIPRLGGSVLGTVGAGRIGRAVAERARAFGMTTIATYHHPPSVADPLLPHHDLIELFALADFVVLAAALTPSSRGMIDADVLRKAKPGLVIVNVARGALVDEDALADALDAGVVGGAALDVRVAEPPDPATDRLSGRPNVLQTPHVGAATARLRADLHRLAAAEAIALLEAAGRIPPSPSPIDD